jgi:activating signal cointegrator 1
MKALTLHQPWATLVAIEAKKIETRSWPTDYRGPLAIHSSSAFTTCNQNIASKRIFIDAKYDHFFEKKKDWELVYPLGCILSICEIVNCIQIPDEKKSFPRLPLTKDDLLPFFPDNVWLPPKEPELSFGDYTPGRYAWILDRVQPLYHPIPVKGMQRLWEWDEAGLAEAR